MLAYDHVPTIRGKTDRMCEENRKKLPWIEKYRPKQMTDIISHKDIIGSLDRFMEMKTLPHLLFFGPPGSGKTSTIVCCARKIYGDYMNCMVLQLNASNERGIDVVRTKIKDFVSHRNNIFLPKVIEETDINSGNGSMFKLVILDEIDSMTVEAQDMLRRTIEDNSRTTRFCLICNEIDKINLALQSRCALFRFSPLRADDMKKRLIEICDEENIKFEVASLNSVIKLTKGDMRSAINMLQSMYLSGCNKITVNDIYKLAGFCTPDIITEIYHILSLIYKKKITLSKSIDDIMNFVLITILLCLTF